MNLMIVLAVVAVSVANAASVDFVQDVRPIFEKHCYSCHGTDKQKSEFRLDVREVALQGGEHHAPNIVPGRSALSPLFRFISGAEKDLQMPPKKALSADEVNVLRRWIDEGAVWPDGVDVAQVVDKTDWWSFKPLQPQQQAHAPRSDVIDGLIGAKLHEHGLSPAPEADARTLIRRLYFDLIGLPPTPEEVHGFEVEAAGNKQRALEGLVDRLLASPRYGERWARHWLDVVHFGETHGYDKDKPRNNAWPYRDYVIRAFNEDKPYVRFVEEQIAGDVLYPGTTDGVTALGFISAGPWDFIGHAEVPESKLDGKIARHLDRDDMVQNTIGSFCSLTVGCAQCHNHKFDPISQKDYYALQAVFAAVDRTDIPYYADDATMARFVKLDQERKSFALDLAGLEVPLKGKVQEQLNALERRMAVADEKLKLKDSNANVRPDYGYHSALSAIQNAVKWVQVDLGQSMVIGKVLLLPCYDDYNKIGAGFGFPVRFKVECSDDPEFKRDVTLLWKKHDLTFMNDFPNPGITAFATGGTETEGSKGRYVRVTAVKLAPRANDFIFALAELQVFDDKGVNAALGRAISALDSIEAPPRWRKTNLTDGLFPAGRTQEDRGKLMKERDELVLSAADPAVREKMLLLKDQLQNVNEQLRKLPPPNKVYAGSVHTGSGAFAGTGAQGGKPRVIHILKRGDVKTPGETVLPSGIQAITEMAHLSEVFPDTDDEGARRAALAHWITDHHNPLTWRSIVNRVWQYHFGQGLADTANDFGRMGSNPSHPELMDYLAAVFRDDLGGSMKKLHRLIVLSQTYRQCSSVGADAEGTAIKVDSNNHLVWRQNRRKLDAEAIRDSVLALSGKLDLTMGGPSFQDFVIEKPEHSPHYEYRLHDPEDPKSWRRSIYRFTVRSQPQPFMNTLDCADPSIRVDRRNESLSALQALTLMNNGLMVVMARHFAQHVQELEIDTTEQVRRAFQMATSRLPLAEELASLASYRKAQGLENTCRVLLNTNEFSFVD